MLLLARPNPVQEPPPLGQRLFLVILSGYWQAAERVRKSKLLSVRKTGFGETAVADRQQFVLAGGLSQMQAEVSLFPAHRHSRNVTAVEVDGPGRLGNCPPATWCNDATLACARQQWRCRSKIFTIRRASESHCSGRIFSSSRVNDESFTNSFGQCLSWWQSRRREGQLDGPVTPQHSRSLFNSAVDCGLSEETRQRLARVLRGSRVTQAGRQWWPCLCIFWCA